jgi:hypothetical protein
MAVVASACGSDDGASSETRKDAAGGAARDTGTPRADGPSAIADGAAAAVDVVAPAGRVDAGVDAAAGVDRAPSSDVAVADTRVTLPADARTPDALSPDAAAALPDAAAALPDAAAALPDTAAAIPPDAAAPAPDAAPPPSDAAPSGEDAGAAADDAAAPGDAADAAPDAVATPDTPGLPDGPLNFPSGFGAKANGFAFENYTNDPLQGTTTPPTNLTAAEMRRFFGDAVCSNGAAAQCALVPQAANWMEKINQGMSGGHCEGMAVLSLLMFHGKVDPTSFGAAKISDLTLAGNDKLQRELAYWFTTQALEPGGLEIIAKPSEIVAWLAQAFRAPGPSMDDTYTIGIFKPGPKAGHAVTPTGLVDKGDGKTVGIKVYDNNYPGEDREILVDLVAETWKYTASINPSEPGSEYAGDAGTGTLRLARTSNRLAKQACPFCGEVQTDGTIKGAAVAYREVTLLGDADLLITDPGGKKLGYQSGRLVNEIPGARVVSPRSADLWKDDAEPTYRLPLGTPLVISLDGSTLTKASLSSVVVVAPGYTFAVEDVMLDPGQNDTIELAGGSGSLVYSTSGSETPDLEIGVELAGADYLFVIKTASETDGVDVALQLDLGKGTLRIDVDTKDGMASYDIEVIRASDTSVQTFRHRSNAVSTADAVFLDYASWRGQGTPMKLLVDAGENGSIDSMIDLSDED